MNLNKKIVVQKFGGTSVANLDRIRNVAAIVVETKRQGIPVVVVVSAMAGETDRLLKLCSSISPNNTPNTPPNPGRASSEIDVVASTGETVVAALTTLAIRNLGEKARSFMGYQLPILTDSNAGSAQILSINPVPLLKTLERGEIPVVAGFQGVDEAGSITTLGRGGSDTTAVAIAAALGDADCEIYTDVDGVYTADPRTLPRAQRIPSVSYTFMIEAAGLGAKVMHDRSVAIGLKHNVPIKVKSTFQNGEGTEIGNKETHSRCVTVDNLNDGFSKVSLVGDFVHSSTTLISTAISILKNNGIACLGTSQGLMSFTSLVPVQRSLDAAQLFHSNYVEIPCN